MTFEEKILEAADEKCGKIYRCELAGMTVSMMGIIAYICSFNYMFLMVTSFCLIICAACESVIYHIEKQARKQVARRLKILNKSLELTIQPFPKDRLIIEKIEFDREYSFLKGDNRND